MAVISKSPVSLLSVALSVCCGAGSWIRLNSCRERERGSARASSSLSLPSSTITSPTLLQFGWSLFQLDKCTLMQLQPHHPDKKTLPDLHTPTSPNPQHSTQHGVRLWLNTPVPPMTPCTPTSTSRSLHPSCHNALSLSWQYKWTKVSAYSAAFQKEKERKTSA